MIKLIMVQYLYVKDYHSILGVYNHLSFLTKYKYGTHYMCIHQDYMRCMHIPEYDIVPYDN